MLWAVGGGVTVSATNDLPSRGAWQASTSFRTSVGSVISDNVRAPSEDTLRSNTRSPQRTRWIATFCSSDRRPRSSKASIGRLRVGPRYGRSQYVRAPRTPTMTVREAAVVHSPAEVEADFRCGVELVSLLPDLGGSFMEAEVWRDVSEDSSATQTTSVCNSTIVSRITSFKGDCRAAVGNIHVASNFIRSACPLAISLFVGRFRR
jgi:hypothetical protein